MGSATLADAEKAKPGLHAIIDYLVRLIEDVMAKYPAGKLPPVELLTQRSPEEVDAVLRGPLAAGGRHLYTLGYPP